MDRNRKQEVLRNPAWVLLSAAAVAALGACATRGARVPASDGNMNKHVASFTLVNDPEVEKNVRVHEASSTSKVSVVRVKAGANVACQAGLPSAAGAATTVFEDGTEAAPAPQPTASSDGMIAFAADKDIYCASLSGTRNTIEVEYLAPRAVATYEEAQVTDYALLQQALEDLKQGNYSAEALGRFQAMGLVQERTIQVTPPSRGKTPPVIEAPIKVAAGDLLVIRDIEGQIAANVSALARKPLDETGLPMVTVAQAAKNAAALAAGKKVKAVKPPVDKKDKSLIFPDERVHRVLCTLSGPSGGPSVIVRGGDGAATFTDLDGEVNCGVNQRAKKPVPMVGAFSIRTAQVRKAEAIEKVAAMMQSRDQAKLALERSLDEKIVESIRAAAVPLVAKADGLVAQLDALVEARADAEAARLFAEEQERAKPYFPDQITLAYRKGVHEFVVQPTKVTMKAFIGGAVDYADYAIREGHTFWIPSNPKANPALVLKENPFKAPSIQSTDKWDMGAAKPAKFIVCAKDIPDMAVAIQGLVKKGKDGKEVSREMIVSTLSKHSVDKAESCSTWLLDTALLRKPTFENLSFKRGAEYTFCYEKVKSETKNGRETIEVLAYLPSRIEATYTAPNGVTTLQKMSREDNKKFGPMGLSFFKSGFEYPVRWVEAEPFAKEACVTANTLFPATQANGLIEGFKPKKIAN